MPPVRPLTILSLRACTCVHVEADGGFAEREAPVLPVLRDLQRVRVLEQRLGRDAAPVEAGAAEHRRALDDRGLQPELRGADRRDVAAGARADHHDVVFVWPLAHFGLLLADRGQRDERDAQARRNRRSARLGLGLFRVEPRDLRAQPRVVVPQLPVRTASALESCRRARLRGCERREAQTMQSDTGNESTATTTARTLASALERARHSVSPGPRDTSLLQSRVPP